MLFGYLRAEGTLSASHMAVVGTQELLTTLCPRRQAPGSTLGHQAEGAGRSSMKNLGLSAEQHGLWHRG